MRSSPRRSLALPSAISGSRPGCPTSSSTTWTCATVAPNCSTRRWTPAASRRWPAGRRPAAPRRPGCRASVWMASIVEPYSRSKCSDHCTGQLARLADRHETQPQPQRERGAEDEATRLHSAHHAGVRRGMLGHHVDDVAEGVHVAQQRGDVLEPDARLREVQHVTDQVRRPGHPGIAHRHFFLAERDCLGGWMRGLGSAVGSSSVGPRCC